MKKQLVASLAAAMVLGVAGTSFAASNPFVDVPAKHWAYDSVTKLAQAGIVDGYSDGKYQGDKVMSRYEMAQIVAKAMAKSDKADASQKAAIDKLAVEFASELEGLNVRVSKLEKNTDHVKFSGEVRARYDHTKFADVTTGNQFKNLIRLDAEGQINDEWKAGIRWENEKNFHTDSDRSGSENRIVRGYVTGPVAGAKLTLGRFGEVVGAGGTFDDDLSGAKIEFGNVLKTKLLVANTDVNFADKKVSAIQFDYNFSKATSAVASYQKWEDKTAASIDAVKIWDLGLTSKLSDNFSVYGSYSKTTEQDNNKGYVAGVSYKGANKAKEGSYGMYLNYENMKGAFLGVDNTYNIGQNQKGYVFGASYVPAKNILVGVRYMDYKAQATDIKGKAFRAQAEFFF